MTLWPGDRVRGVRGEFTVERMVAYQGCDAPGPYCSQIDGRCVGWHCAGCDAPTSSQGHDCSRIAA